MTGSNVNSNAELKRVKIFPHQVSPYRNLCIANQGGQQNIVRNKCLYFHFNNKKVQCIDLYQANLTHIETIQIICPANKLTGFYMSPTWA